MTEGIHFKLKSWEVLKNTPRVLHTVFVLHHRLWWERLGSHCSTSTEVSVPEKSLRSLKKLRPQGRALALQPFPLEGWESLACQRSVLFAETPGVSSTGYCSGTAWLLVAEAPRGCGWQRHRVAAGDTVWLTPPQVSPWG